MAKLAHACAQCLINNYCLLHASLVIGVGRNSRGVTQYIGKTSEDIESTETTFNITLTSDSIQPNKTYYLVLSPYPTSNSSYAKVLPASFSGYVTYSASATVVSAGSGTIGSSLAITMTNDGMSHELTYSFEGVSGTIGTTTSSSYTWAVPVSLAGQIPAATSGTCRITCTSDAGSTYVDITLTVPDVSAFRPSISSVSISLDNSMNSTVEGWGIYLQGFSKLIINAEATAGYSTIASWRIDYIIGSISGTGSGASLSLSQTSPILMQPGMYPVSLTVTDARGRIATADDVDYFTVHAYSTPNITDPVMYRCTSDGVRDDENGTYLYSSGTPTFSSCDGHNSVSTQFEYKERSAANYVSAAFTNKIGVLVVPENKEGIYFDYELENEIFPALTNDKDLFAGITTTNEMLDRIGCGFKDADLPLIGNERQNFLMLMFEAFADEDDCWDEEEDEEENEDEEEEVSSGNWDYDLFAAKVNRLNYANVHTVVLMTNNATEEDVREFVWMRYDLKTGAVTRGTGNGLISDWRNPDACTPTPKEYIVSVAL